MATHLWVLTFALLVAAFVPLLLHRSIADALASGASSRSFIDRGVQESVITPPKRNAVGSGPLSPITSYVVEPGDTVPTIAARAGIGASTLMQVNQLASGDSLSVGDVLSLPPVDGIVVSPSPGESVVELAGAYHVDALAICQVNAITLLSPLPSPVFIPGLAPPRPSRMSPVPPDGSRPGLLHFVWPTQGTISQPFFQYHPGIDIANGYGTPEVAAAAGQVVFAGAGSYGIYVEIDHGDGYHTIYGHMEQTLVSVGQTVSAGQQIGLMGSTGRSTGPHLHFQVMHNGVPQNPLNFLST